MQKATPISAVLAIGNMNIHSVTLVPPPLRNHFDKFSNFYTTKAGRGLRSNGTLHLPNAKNVTSLTRKRSGVPVESLHSVSINHVVL